MGNQLHKPLSPVVGAHLPNDSHVLMTRPVGDYDVVLCLFGSQFAVWDYDRKTRITTAGSYDRDLEKAIEIFKER